MEINPLTTIIRDRNNNKRYFVYTFYLEQEKRWETVVVRKINYESLKRIAKEISYTYEEAVRHHTNFVAHYGVF